MELDKTGVPGAGAGRSGRPAIETNRTEVLIQIGAPRTTAASHRMVSGASHRKVSGDSNAINVRTYLLICMTKVTNVDEATDVRIAFTQIIFFQLTQGRCGRLVKVMFMNLKRTTIICCKIF